MKVLMFNPRGPDIQQGQPDADATDEVVRAPAPRAGR